MEMEVVVGMLVMWAVNKARQAGKEVDGLADYAGKLIVQRLYLLVNSTLGADPAIRQLVLEAQREGDASPDTRSRAEAALRARADRDVAFATELREILTDAEKEGVHSVSNYSSGNNSGNYRGNFTGNGFANVGNNNKIKNVVKNIRRSPAAVFAALAVLLIAGAAVWYFISHSDSAQVASSKMVGTWTSSDGTSTKIFGDNGQCKGFYYDNGAPLDIGGPMQCAISARPDSDNRYDLTVIQTPNEASYKVEFTSADHALVYSTNGQKLYELTRF
jgi:hypothetical protein